MDSGIEVPPDIARPARSYQFVFAVVLAALGGLLGIIGALIQEGRTANFLLLPFVAAPIIEEAMKPIGVWIALIRWPQLFRSQLFTALLSALGGLVFGIIESLVYVTVYVSHPPHWFVVYRFSATLGFCNGWNADLCDNVRGTLCGDGVMWHVQLGRAGDRLGRQHSEPDSELFRYIHRHGDLLSKWMHEHGNSVGESEQDSS